MEMLSIKQAAAELGVPARTINHRLKTGAMQGQRIDGWLWVIPRDEVERWRKKQQWQPDRKRKSGA